METRAEVFTPGLSNENPLFLFLKVIKLLKSDNMLNITSADIRPLHFYMTFVQFVAVFPVKQQSWHHMNVCALRIKVHVVGVTPVFLHVQ